MVADKPDFLVDLGDTFMTDKHKDFHDAIKQYRAQRYFFGIFGSTAPVYLALGNHDGEAADERNKPGMAAWSMAQRKLHYPPPTTGNFYTGNTETGDYFEVKWGDAQCFILDPFNFTKSKPGRDANNWNWTLGNAQYQWLKKALATSKAKYKFVFVHHLVGGQGKDARGGAEASHFFEWGGKNWDGTDGFLTNRPDWEAPLHELFKKHGVQVVFRGHDHLYVRQERDGIFYQLVPQPSQRRGDNTRSAEEYGYKSGTILGASGYMRVSISSGESKVEYVYTQGGQPQIRDSYAIKPTK
jgi:predicted phosphodiesterase